MREYRTTPRTMSGADVIRYAAWQQSYLDLGGREGAPSDPVHIIGVKRLSAFFELPYWQINTYYKLSVGTNIQCIVSLWLT